MNCLTAVRPPFAINNMVKTNVVPQACRVGHGRARMALFVHEDSVPSPRGENPQRAQDRRPRHRDEIARGQTSTSTIPLSGVPDAAHATIPRQRKLRWEINRNQPVSPKHATAANDCCEKDHYCCTRWKESNNFTNRCFSCR